VSTATETTALREIVPPYVGLTHFTEATSELFFGRDRETSIIAGNLCASRLTLLYAESGVGKSSLLRAGVMARIRRQALRDQDNGRNPHFVVTVFCGWTDDPVAGLIAALGEAVKPFAEEGIELLGNLEHVFEAAASSLGTTLLVILDQFEEYFLYRSRTNGTDTFADEVARCFARPELPVNFLISIREDMYAGLGDLFRGRIPNVYGNFLHLDYLRREDAREAIVEPIRRLQKSHPEIHVEPELADAVLDGVRLTRGAEQANGQPATSRQPRIDERGERIETAYLQLVMRRIWDEEVRAGSPVLRLATLERLGGTQEIIDGHLNRAMREFGGPDQDTAASAFRFLVTRAGTKIPWTAKDLAEVADVDEDKLKPVLRRLAEGDLKILRPIAAREGGDGASYEIFHDALARPIVRWREDHAVERERKAKEEAEQKAAAATEQASTEKKRRQIALAALATALVALVAVAIVATYAFQQKRSAHERLRAAQAGDVMGRLTASGGVAAFPADAVALASAEVDRQLAATFDARSAAIAFLQENAGIPKILAGHRRAVLSAAFGPAPAVRFASASADGTIQIRRNDGRLVKKLRTSDGERLPSVAFSPNGKVVAGGRGDGGIDLWIVDSHDSGLTLFRPRDPAPAACTTLPCTPVAFSPDQAKFAEGASDGTVRVWDTSRLDGRPQVWREPAAVHGIAFSPDGRVLAVAGDFGVHEWHVARPGRLAFSRDMGSPAPAYVVAWAPNGTLAAGTDATVELWRPGGRRLRPIDTVGSIYALAFVHGDSRVAYGGADQAVTVRDVRTREEIGPPRSHGSDVHALAASPDGRTLVSGSDDGVVKLWRANGAGALATTTLGVVGETALGISSNGWIATGNLDDGPVFVWTRARGEGPAHALRRRIALRNQKGPLAIRGHWLVTTSGADPTSFTIWDLGRSCKRMPAEPCREGSRASDHGSLHTMALDPTGDLVATGSEDGWLMLWDVSDPSHIQPAGEHRVTRGYAVNQVAFDPFRDGILTTASDDGVVRLWRFSNRKLDLIDKTKPGDAKYAVAFSPSSDATKRRLLAAAGADQKVSLWDVTNPANLREVSFPTMQSQSIFSLEFSGDGRTLAAGDGDGSVCFYDVNHLRAMGSGRCLTGSVGGDIDALAFDPSGDAILSAGRGEPVVAWNRVLWGGGSDSELRDAVCRIARRNLTKSEWDYAFDSTNLAHHWHATCPRT
jgi:WD40 repeat protein